MDFRAVLKLIGEDFHKEGVRYALIGGFALGALGVPRATIDLDFIVDSDDLNKIDRILKACGYNRVYESEDAAQYISDMAVFGGIDFLLAHRSISRRMIEQALEKELFSRKLKVLRPEDVIGLKIQALSNDETRAAKEYLDIESLLGLYKKNLDWSLLEEYFTLFDLGSKYQEYRNKYYA